MSPPFFLQQKFKLSLILNDLTDTITPLPGVPKDFELVYGSGVAHADWGSTKYTISADGSAVKQRIKHFRDKDQNPEIKRCQLTAEELGGLWKEIQAVKFFRLKENYTNPRIMDGSSNFIYVKANGKEHTVSVMNTEVKAFDRIANDVENLFDKKVAR